MANTATAKGALSGFGGLIKYGQVTPYLINYDAINTDLTIRTPETGGRIAVVGFMVLNDAAYNLSFKSASTIIQTLKFDANGGMSHPFYPSNPAILFTTEESEALRMTCNAVLPPFMLYTLES